MTQSTEPPPMNQVIELGQYRFSRKDFKPYDKTQCQHKHTELDDNGNIVTCLDCGKQVDPYFVLRMLTQDWGNIQTSIERQRQQLEQEKDKHIHLLAAREVERAWRDRQMVPTCPHCGEGISSTDGFGRGAISKKIDAARRLHRQAQRQAAAQNTDAQ